MVNLRSFSFVLLLLVVQGLRSQSATGIRSFIDLYNTDGLEGRTTRMTVAGLGIDHDLTPRLSLGLDVAFGLGVRETFYGGGNSSGVFEVNSLSFIYRSAYCFSSNEDRTAGYFGPFIGYSRVMTDLQTYDPPGNWSGSRTVLPVGVRMGVRGGLRGFYADLFCNLGYRINTGPLFEGIGVPETNDLRMKGLLFSVGVALGGGWEY